MARNAAIVSRIAASSTRKSPFEDRTWPIGTSRIHSGADAPFSHAIRSAGASTCDIVDCFTLFLLL